VAYSGYLKSVRLTQCFSGEISLELRFRKQADIDNERKAEEDRLARLKRGSTTVSRQNSVAAHSPRAQPTKAVPAVSAAPPARTQVPAPAPAPTPSHGASHGASSAPQVGAAVDPAQADKMKALEAELEKMRQQAAAWAEEKQKMAKAVDAEKSRQAKGTQHVYL
jgi:type IV secretory pathway VirB10-like protein